MFQVRIEPAGITIPARAGQTLTEAAEAAGWYWPNVCGGVARCAVCACDPVDPEALSQPAERELACLALHFGEAVGRARLGCQARVQGDAVIERSGLARMPWAEAGRHG
jgi:2Fe-2S ferredoxin